MPSPAKADYDRMAEAIRFIDENREEQPSLEAVAAHLNLSPAHFQRLFSRWVGVSPKKYLSYLTLDHAKRLLEARMSVLDAAYESGLSGPSRLHDLFVTWEAMTPGEFSRRGAGVTICHAWIDTPYGEALVMTTPRGICGLAFSAEMGREATFADMASRWPGAAFVGDDAASARAANAAIAGEPATLAPIGAPFQIKVWEALMAVPEGQVTTYSALAEAVGSPRAVRAVGTAVGRNPISLLIPCHRALRKSGGLGGYHWGLGVKRAMLAREAARAEAV